MKIRQGFVSNSSSSSFIIQGIKISMDEMAKIEENHRLCDFDLMSEDDRFYFSNDEPTGVIIGVNGGDMEDGCVTKIKSLTDEEKEAIVEKLKNVGVETTKDQIDTYVQFVSNDNY